ncbi:XTP/dITP diphosphatase [Brevibacillus sp. 7WMA2]|uniref:XTP/dITP diphosphatase n=1 Tax=Brevibacillus sp. 7WMA2 TaxID=2683193 RepID=UPI0013A7276E|nr:XTP/dITP diphosphatase [Brevibacillus sp. 7WMA2]QIC08008.1 XTP/dITP diphosphatase [Brevibacillus sp. 7WMA2]WPS89065.1 XTP/dITP diphosphatase [Brevibacillus halotolerans]
MSEQTAKKKVVLATRNQGKVREFNKLFEVLNLEAVSVSEFPDAPEVEEDGETFEANALKKAKTISEVLGLPAIGDDSGLEVDALRGAPGVYSARFAGEQATDEENYQKLLTKLADVPMKERTARFRCTLAYVEPGQEPVIATGACEGAIAHAPSGSNGFGYDPVFFVPSQICTMAELSPEQKNTISHRAMAMKDLLEKLKGR